MLQRQGELSMPHIDRTKLHELSDLCQTYIEKTANARSRSNTVIITLTRTGCDDMALQMHLEDEFGNAVPNG